MVKKINPIFQMRQKLLQYNVYQKYARLMLKVKGDPSSKKIFFKFNGSFTATNLLTAYTFQFIHRC